MIDQAARLRAIVSGEDRPVGAAAPAIRREAGATRVIAVTSGKGGVGKTVISVNLGLLLAELGHSVLLVDADLGLANVDVMLGIDSARHIGHLLSGSYTPDEIAATGPSGLRVISGGSGLRELAEAGATERQILLEILASYYRQYEYVVLDTSPGISGSVIDFLESANDILLVTTPERTSLADTYAALKTIRSRLFDSRIQLVVNCAAAGQASAAVSALNNVAAKFLGFTFEQWQHVEPDTVVTRSIGNRVPVVSSHPRSGASLCMRRLAKSVTRMEVSD